MNFSDLSLQSTTHYPRDERRRNDLIEAGMKPKIEYFIKGGRNLGHEFFLSLYRQDILIESEYKDSQNLGQAKMVATKEVLEKIEEYENSVYERMTSALLRLFPEFKPLT